MATILDLARTAVEELLKKMLVLFRSDGSVPFWIGDSPVVLDNTINPGDRLRSNLGLGVPGIEIYLPISSGLVLAHLCPSIATVSAAAGEEARRMGFIDARAHSFLQALMNSSPILVGEDDVENLNRLELAYAERWVYSSANNFDNARKMLEENPKLRTGPRVL